MPNGDRPTEDQHFVPQMYLRGFSEVKGKDKCFIWQFNLKSMQQTAGQVNIRNICYEKNLYEMKTSDNTFIAHNLIENTFGKIENETNRVIQSLISKSQNNNCLSCQHILSEDEKAYLIILLVTILFRDPQTIDNGIRFLQETNPGIDLQEARNFTLMNLLPLSSDPVWNENTIMRSALKRFYGMAFQIGIADEDLIFTSERPVISYPFNPDDPYHRPKAVVFPLTSKMVLYLFPWEEVEPTGRNCFIKLIDKQIEDLQTNIAVCAREWIYSRVPLTDEQITRIEKERRNREKLEG